MAQKYNKAFGIPASIGTDSPEPSDPRYVVELLSDLTTPEDLNDPTRLNYIYEGIFVYVLANKGTYQWNGEDRTDINNWIDQTTKNKNDITAVMGSVSQLSFSAVSAATSYYDNVATDPKPDNNTLVYITGEESYYKWVDYEPTRVQFVKSIALDNEPTTASTKGLQSGGTKVYIDQADALKVNISDVKDNLTSEDADKPLSAKQGKVLNEKIKQPTIDYIAFSNYTTANKNLIDVSDTTKTYVVFDTDLGRLENYKDGAWRAVSDEEALALKADLEPSKNLFNPNASINNKIINSSGVISNNNFYFISEYIPVIVGESYTSNINMRFTAYFDSNKNPIVGGSDSALATTTAPANASFLVFSIANSIDINTLQLEEGTFSTTFEPYKLVVNGEKIKNNTIKSEKLENLSIQEEKIDFLSVNRDKTTFFEKSKNLFNYQDSGVVRGAFFAGNGLIQSGNSSYSLTGFIPCKPNTNYKINKASFSGATYNVYFDKNKEIISTTVSTSQILTPANAVYLRCTLGVTSTDDANLELTQIEEGTVSTSFVAYKNVIKEDALPENLRNFDPNVVGTPGADGADGLSAYEIAVNGGFVGTETEWLTSLQGEAGTSSDVIDTLYSNNLLRTQANLFDVNAIDYSIDTRIVDGVESVNSFFDTSGFIPIEEGNTVWGSNYTNLQNITDVNFYDVNKDYIIDSHVNNQSKIDAPANSKFFRVTIAKTLVAENSFYLEVAPVRSQMFFPPSSELIPSVNYNGYLKAFLPPKIYVGLGRIIEIYNSQVALYINENDYKFEWNAFNGSKKIGTTFKNKFVIDTSSNSVSFLDTYRLILTIYDKYLRVVKIVESSLVVVDMTVDIPTPLNILPMGDSLLNKPYLHQTRDLLSAKFGKTVLNWIGTRAYLHGTAQDKIDIKHEGFSGWRSDQFVNDAGIYQNNNLKLTVSPITTPPVSKKIYTFTLEDTSTQDYEVEDLFNENNEIFTGANGTLTYITFNALQNPSSDPVSSGTITETNSSDAGDATITFSQYTDIGGNPFWNNTTDAVDFPNYLSQNSLPTPDAIMTMLGTNNTSDFQSTIELINIAQTQLSNIPAFIILPQYNGNFLNDISIRKTWFEHIEGLVTGLINTSNVYFIPVAMCHDSENNCFNGFTTINPHNAFVETKIYTASDFVHPQDWGYTQFSDVIYSTLLAEYTNL